LEHTVEGLHAGQVEFPAQVLAVDLSQVGYIESVLFARLTSVGIDASNLLFENLLD
jgi:hypothetical protein